MNGIGQEQTSPGPWIEPRGQTLASVGDRVIGVPLGRLSFGWLAAIGITLAVVMMMLAAISWLIVRGVGIWGINIPVAWGFAIINFVWWIGIGHAGTLTSAFLLLMRQRWRTSINRMAEAMTLFAVANAGLFPLLHLGRPEKFYYLLPYPDTLNLWPQWRSPLVWDVIAVLTYGLVSLIFWYVGLLPDLATMRDRAAKLWVRRTAGVLALGWRNSVRHWHRHQTLYLLLAGLATPLVVSVHSIVSLDFAVTVVPGWHSTIFPPYFVAGAIFSGFAMVLTVAIPVRRIFHFEDLVTRRHLDNLGKVMLVSGLIVSYGYMMEAFIAWFSADRYEAYMAMNRITGDYWPVTFLVLLCNVLVPQALWFHRVRTSPVLLFVIAQFVNVGMWVERYMIIAVSLHRDFMPSAWGGYHGTLWDWMLFIGSLGFFAFLMTMFLRLVPMSSIFELRELLHEQGLAKEQSGREPLPDQSGLQDERVHGVIAEFDDPERLKEATSKARERGYRRMDAYCPFPLEGMADALGLGRSRIALITLVAGLAGAAAMFGLQWYAAVADYPWNIGGRPTFSWPSFIPLTFEVGVLSASICGVAGMFLLNGFPRLYHPVFDAVGFERASVDRFFLCIESGDERFDREATRAFLESFEPLRVSLVPRCEVS